MHLPSPNVGNIFSWPIRVIITSVLFFSVACTDKETEEAEIIGTKEQNNVRITGSANLINLSEKWAEIELTAATGQSTLTFDFPEAPLDVSDYQYVGAQIMNDSGTELDVLLTAISKLDTSWSNRAQGRFLVLPGEEYDLLAFMTRPRLPNDHPMVVKLGNLYGFPGGHHRHWEIVQPDNILRVNIRIMWEEANTGDRIKISNPFGAVDYSSDASILETLDFPIVDQFGQFRSEEWMGKLETGEELQKDRTLDLKKAEAAQVGEELSPYGGWLAGPRQEATGFFRVQRIDSQWWFIDPDGYLFWSLGTNSTGRGSPTKVTGREALFPEGLTGNVSFYEENLKQKYGEDNWLQNHVDVTLGRMLDWGINTVGAWSMNELNVQHRVPYTLIVHTNKQGIGSIGKMPDPYSDAFKSSLTENLSALAKTHAESPWLLGVFIHNELEWRAGNVMGEEILGSPKWKPARKAAIAHLDQKYGSINKLNQSWKTEFDGFTSIKPRIANTAAYRSDLDEIAENFASKYFQVCRDAMRKYFPNHLYLGCRFNNFHPIVTRAASRYCDVVSANVYHFGAANFSMASDEDRPIIIGEFHFGIGDFGHWGKGLRTAVDARNQADLMRLYLEDALSNPSIVGAHWFSWSDQPITGRFDGENFGIGLVSIVDRPHQQLVDSLSQVADNLYIYRLTHNK